MRDSSWRATSRDSTRAGGESSNCELLGSDSIFIVLLRVRSFDRYFDSDSNLFGRPSDQRTERQDWQDLRGSGPFEARRPVPA
jgi:hypothetical protein